MLAKADTRHLVGTLVGAIAACLLFVGGGFQAWRFERAKDGASLAGAQQLIYLPTPEIAKLVSLGFDAVFTDYYWVKALQYFTNYENEQADYRNLPDFLDLVVAIDPDFRYAYKFAGISVPYRDRQARWHNTARATAILERGVERFPDDWELHFYLGYNYLNYQRRHEEAAEQFSIAARLPEAPSYLHGLATRVFSVGGALDRALEFTRFILETSEDLEVRAMMTRRFNELIVERELLRIENAVDSFREAHGRRPNGIDEMTGSGLLEPSPPAGFEIDAEGRAYVAGFKRLGLHRDAKDSEYMIED